MLSWTLECNAINRAVAGKQAAGPSNPPSSLVGGDARSFTEQEEKAFRIFEERRLVIQQECQTLDDSRDHFLVTLATHPSMANRPILRNDPKVKDFFGEVGADEVRLVAINHRTVLRYLATPPLGNHRSQVSAPVRSTSVAGLVKGSADHRLDEAEVLSLQQYNRRLTRRIRRGWFPIYAEIAYRQDPDRCPNFCAGGRVEQGQVPHQGKVPRFVALLRREDQVGHNC